METKKEGGFKTFLDSIHQTSWNFVEISTVVCGIFWGLNKFKMAAIAMVTKVQKMLDSNRTADPFETWHKNRSIDNLETQKKPISMENSQFFDYLLYAKSK